jgi:hypothetical protein
MLRERLQNRDARPVEWIEGGDRFQLILDPRRSKLELKCLVSETVDESDVDFELKKGERFYGAGPYIVSSENELWVSLCVSLSEFSERSLEENLQSWRRQLRARVMRCIARRIAEWMDAHGASCNASKR